MNFATFAGGCFWCIEPLFLDVKGIKNVNVGYMGGRIENPTYEEVCKGNSGHLEVVQVEFDENKISYEQLLDIFWHAIDPTDSEGQFADRGEQYTTAIFYHNEADKKIAEKSKKEVQRFFDKEVVTKIRPAIKFYLGEREHQNYCNLHPLRYKLYIKASGRKYFLEKQWGKDLTNEQKEVALKQGTECAFANAYYDNKEPGIYVDAITGKPLFSSADKFESGTGWPSFKQPIDNKAVYEKNDLSHGMKRIEVRSGITHLGHKFEEGENYRYCINSASIRFIPAKELRKQGYEKWLNRIK